MDHINCDLSRSDVEDLLSGFLIGSLNVELKIRLTALGDLPPNCGAHILQAIAAGRPWVAWSTPSGPMAAWGDYDIDGSRRLNAHQLFIEWWLAPTEHHALWCYCYPRRPTEWTIGRGRHVAAR
jgi:hypothetical protein